MTSFYVIVYGDPQPQGSKRIGRAGGTGRPMILDGNDQALRPWRRLVEQTARASAARLDLPPFVGAVELTLSFTLARPKSVPQTRLFPSVKPDLSKLVRAVEDSLTDAGVWRDDCLVVTAQASKRYVGDGFGLSRPGVEILVKSL